MSFTLASDPEPLTRTKQEMTRFNELVLERGTLQNGEMRQIRVGETDVLLVRHEDRYYALHPYCAHYGAPLAEGALSQGRIVCPWHHACYEAASGYQLEPPGLDSLTRYGARVEGDQLIVSVDEDTAGLRTVDMRGRDEADARTFVVLGGGAAGQYAVEALREEGFSGRLIMITRERHLPYDRPNCSKEYLQDAAPLEWMFLRPEEFYEERDIERMRERTVTEVDTRARTLTFDNGDWLAFDGMILCTGGIPRTLDVPGAGLKGVFTLRSFDDSTLMMEWGKQSRRAVVIGASFIGMEVAFSLRRLGIEEVTVVAPEEMPFARQLGPEIGQLVRSIHEENGVRFRLGRTVHAFHGAEQIEEVSLDDGSTLPADMAVVGIGVRPATDFIKGLSSGKDGSIVVDEYLQATDGIYAAGDIARFPDWRTGQSIRVEHWRVACQQGRVAGYNLAGRSVPYRGVPFFWTAHFDTSIRYVGHATAWDEILFDGRPGDPPFIAFYVADEVVLAAAGIGRDRDMAAIEDLMRREVMPPVDELRRGGVDYVARLRSVSSSPPEL